MKRILAVMILSIFIVLQAVTPVSAAIIGEVEYWYSNSINIGVWSQSVTTSWNLVTSGLPTFIYDATSWAQQRWYNAGIPVSLVSGGETIPIYGGNASDLETYMPGITGYAGLTIYSCTFVGQLEYNGALKNCYLLSSAKCGVVYGSSRNHRSVATHELGHALGWFGHSTSSSAIMYTYEGSIEYLNYRDSRQLYQVYD